jgi:hypothetical protein
LFSVTRQTKTLDFLFGDASNENLGFCFRCCFKRKPWILFSVLKNNENH